MKLSGKYFSFIKKGDVSLRLIYLNVGIFLLVNLFTVIFGLFEMPFKSPITWLAMSDDVSELLTKPWVFLTYMFLHVDMLHIFFNMLTFYWFAKIFLMFYTDRQLIGLYVVGGLIGAVLFVVFYNIFPLFVRQEGASALIGASASVLAVVVGVALTAPNMLLRVLFFGNVKLKYIAIVMVLISLFSITSENAGGNIAHLGGALAGFLFVVSLRKQFDFTRWVDFLLDKLTFVSASKKMRVKAGGRSASGSKMSDGEYNMMKAQRMKEIDRILDKIKTSGYESLTADEKKKLFN